MTASQGSRSPSWVRTIPVVSGVLPGGGAGSVAMTRTSPRELTRATCRASARVR